MARRSSKGLGRRQAEDPRDRSFLLAPITREAGAAGSIYYGLRAGAPLNQGNYPRCVEFGWRHFLMASPIRSEWTRPDGEFYSECQRHDEWEGEDYDGTSVRAGAKVLKAQGRLESYHWAFNAGDVKRFLLSGAGPVVIGIDWYEEWDQPEKRKDGQYLQEPKVHTDLGHALVVIGGDFERRKAFRLLNSWGPRWGENGRVWMAEDLFDRVIRNNGEACCGIEKKIRRATLLDERRAA